MEILYVSVFLVITSSLCSCLARIIREEIAFLKRAPITLETCCHPFHSDKRLFVMTDSTAQLRSAPGCSAPALLAKRNPRTRETLFVSVPLVCLDLGQDGAEALCRARCRRGSRAGALRKPNTGDSAPPTGSRPGHQSPRTPGRCGHDRLRARVDQVLFGTLRNRLW